MKLQLGAAIGAVWAEANRAGKGALPSLRCWPYAFLLSGLEMRGRRGPEGQNDWVLLTDTDPVSMALHVLPVLGRVLTHGTAGLVLVPGVFIFSNPPWLPSF